MSDNELSIKWSGKLLKFQIEENLTLKELRTKIFDETQVRPERQKIMGLKAKDDEKIMGKFKPGKPIMMIGSAEKDIEKVQVRNCMAFDVHLLS